MFRNVAKLVNNYSYFAVYLKKLPNIKEKY